MPSCLQVTVALGHDAYKRKKPTPGTNYTHDWKVYVRGREGHPIETFVSRVVFYLHDSFPKPVRVIRNPPFEVSESGYAGFILRIELFFREAIGKDTQSSAFNYDLFFRMDDQPVRYVRYEKLTFVNPSEKQGICLLKAGAERVHYDKETVQKKRAIADATDKVVRSTTPGPIVAGSFQPTADDTKPETSSDDKPKKKKHLSDHQGQLGLGVESRKKHGSGKKQQKEKDYHSISTSKSPVGLPQNVEKSKLDNNERKTVQPNDEIETIHVAKIKDALTSKPVTDNPNLSSQTAIEMPIFQDVVCTDDDDFFSDDSEKKTSFDDVADSKQMPGHQKESMNENVSISSTESSSSLSSLDSDSDLSPNVEPESPVKTVKKKSKSSAVQQPEVNQKLNHEAKKDKDVFSQKNQKKSSHHVGHGDSDQVIEETKSQNNNLGTKKAPNGYIISALKDLQQRIYALFDDEDERLGRVVRLIEDTGLFRLTDETFDFDLCKLDKDTVDAIAACL